MVSDYDDAATFAEAFEKHAEFTGFFDGNDGYLTEFMGICKDADKEIARLRAELEAERGAHAMTRENFTLYAEDRAEEREQHNKALAATEAKLERANSRLKFAMEDARKYNQDVEYCPAREDHQHCDCWWEGGPCCACGAAGMKDEEKRECGMLDETAIEEPA